MGTSDAQRKARDKWLEKMEDVKFRVESGKKALIKAHAEKQGESINAFLNRAVDETMAKDLTKKSESDGIVENL